MNIGWIIGFGVAALVVLVLALLLIGILLQARRIRTLAGVAVEVVGDIDANTRGVWALRETNATAARLLETAQAIEASAGAIRRAVAHDEDAERAA